MTWRHEDAWHSQLTGLTYCMARRKNGSPCECSTPTPDPAGPCGWDDCTATGIHHPRWFPHLPTRCTCGHPIEEATR